MSQSHARSIATAADWLLRRQAGEDVENNPEFPSWLDASDANRSAWRAAIDVWDGFNEEPDMLLAGMRQAALKARPERRNVRPILWGFGSAVAAGAAALLVAQSSLFHPLVTPAQVDRPLATFAYATPVGGRRDVILTDGSHVMLDSGTTMTAAMYKSHREIGLARGQAYFAVAHDAARPFTVTAVGSRVTALGTEFDVLAKPQGMQVLLVSGHVAVADGDRKVRLAPGQSYDSTPGARRIDHPDVHAVLAWRDGYIEFSGEPLGRAVSEMNRYATRRIVVRDRSIADLLMVTGRFKAGDTERFARALADIYGLSVVHQPGDTIELRRSR